MAQEKKIKAMQSAIRSYYRKHGRHTLPWRKTNDPYKILVSEFMLQQTQVSRVVPKYEAFVKRFPSSSALARAPLKDVLMVWSGLGYNRRAKYLHQAAQKIVSEHAGKVPKSPVALEALPGVGHYTAAAVCTFAYNMSLPMIETNIRTVLTHHLFSKKKQVSDKELYTVLEVLLKNNKDPRNLYWAVMDYGTHLKTSGVRINKKSAHYVKQSSFKGSSREIRGAILKLLLNGEKMTPQEIMEKTGFPKGKTDAQLNSLLKEGMVSTRNAVWYL